MRRQVLSLFALVVVACVGTTTYGQGIRLDRLEALATHLDTKVQPSHFNISQWGTTSNPDDPNYVGCAAGHAVTLFYQDGFHLTEAGSLRWQVAYEDKTALDATQAFFGVSDNENQILFTKQVYAGNDPHRAAHNIRKVIAQHHLAQAQKTTRDFLAKATVLLLISH